MVHDLRRIGSTLLNELFQRFNSDWIEKCFAYEDGHSSCGVSYNTFHGLLSPDRFLLTDLLKLIPLGPASPKPFGQPEAVDAVASPDNRLVDLGS